MTRRSIFIRGVPIAAFMLGALVADPDSVWAQQVIDDQARDVTEEIIKIETVKKPQRVGHPNEIGAKIKVIELSQAVYVADLDLREADDAEEFERRIENTAKELCDKVNKLHPMPVWYRANHRRCIRDAVESIHDDS